MNKPKYQIKEKYLYKNFSIVFCITAFNPGGFTTYIRNNNWVEIDFICMEAEYPESLETLKYRARRFLKKPNLGERNQAELGIKIFYKAKVYENYKDYFIRRELEGGSFSEPPEPIDGAFDPEEVYWRNNLFDYN